MKINRQYLIEEIQKGNTQEFNELMNCIDYELHCIKDYSQLIYEWQQAMSESTFENITNNPYEGYEEDLHELGKVFKNLLIKGYSLEQLDSLIEDAKSEYV